VLPHSWNNTNSIHLLQGNIKTSLQTCIWKYPFYKYKLQYNTIYPCLDYPVSRYPYMHFFYINSDMCKLSSCPLSKPYCPPPFSVLHSLSAVDRQLCSNNYVVLSGMFWRHHSCRFCLSCFSTKTFQLLFAGFQQTPN